VKHKTVEIVAYQFDSLPGHIRVSGRGSGATLRVALQRAVGNLFNQPALLRKRIDSFKLSVVAITERPSLDDSIVPGPSLEADDALGTPAAVIANRPKGGAA
jgi:hypothetical protein